MTRYFLSDVHLFPEPEEHPGRERFISFLEHLARDCPAGELWILGDLFDFWFEYRSVTPAGYERCTGAMRSLTDRGWIGQFLPGNHDWWVNGQFERITGFRIHPVDRIELMHDERRILLAHGDGLGPGDTGYKIMRPVLRSKVSMFLFGLLHPALAFKMARKFSDTSRRLLRKEQELIPPGLDEWVRRELEGGFDMVITGHTHLDKLRKLEKGIHVSLGDWLTRFTYCRIRDDLEAPELLEYSPEADLSGRSIGS